MNWHLVSQQDIRVYYLIYKTTNTTNGKIYIGMHQTENLDDAYLGSGTLLKRALKKYGSQQFTKEVLFVFDTFDEMKAKEREIVDEAFVNRDDTYNLNVGGEGGWYRANQTYTAEQRKELSRMGAAAMAQMRVSDPDMSARLRAVSSQNGKLAVANGHLRHQDFTGKKHTETSKQKMRGSQAGKHVGVANVQSKLTESDVRAARAIWERGSPTVGAKALAVKYGVDESTMRDALSGKTWSNIK